MSTGKRYYWIRLKTDFFSTDGPIDLLMSQPHGADYVVLYQMLCLQTVNTGGRMATTVGDVLVPYNEQKIARDTRYFGVDTVRVAMTLYRKLGLIYEETDGVIALAGFDDMVGSESGSAQRMRNLRERRASEALPPASQCDENVTENVTTEKELEIEIESDIESGDSAESQRAPKPRKKFVPPTLEEVIDYCEERKNQVDPLRFYNHYVRVGWMVGKNHMKDWRAAVRYWERDNTPRTATSGTQAQDPPGVHFELENKPDGNGQYYNDIFEED
jgi:predicted phage replisome organizer